MLGLTDQQKAEDDITENNSEIEMKKFLLLKFRLCLSAE